MSWRIVRKELSRHLILLIVVLGVIAAGIESIIWVRDPNNGDRIATLTVAEGLISLGVAAFATYLAGRALRVANSTLMAQVILRSLEDLRAVLNLVSLLGVSNVTDDDRIRLLTLIAAVGSPQLQACKDLAKAMPGNVTAALITAAIKEVGDESEKSNRVLKAYLA